MIKNHYFSSRLLRLLSNRITDILQQLLNSNDLDTLRPSYVYLLCDYVLSPPSFAKQKSPFCN